MVWAKAEAGLRLSDRGGLELAVHARELLPVESRLVSRRVGAEPSTRLAQVLAACAERININAEIMALYLEQLLPGITAPDDDGNYGSAACYDVLCLQARHHMT